MLSVFKIGLLYPPGNGLQSMGNSDADYGNLCNNGMFRQELMSFYLGFVVKISTMDSSSSKTLLLETEKHSSFRQEIWNLSTFWSPIGCTKRSHHLHPNIHNSHHPIFPHNVVEILVSCNSQNSLPKIPGFKFQLLTHKSQLINSKFQTTQN